jgi:RNA polymerase sigma-70 factor (ECF subfamily)
MVTDDDGLATFLSVRARLVRTTYRMLRSAAAAEDVVQEAWIRWQSTNRGAIRDSAAFLRTTAIRLAINVRQSAYSRRETSAAQWPSEPAVAEPEQVVQAERADALMFGVSVLLERLSSPERVAYTLREACDYSYRDIANVLGLREANARQLVRRARLHLTQRPMTQSFAENHSGGTQANGSVTHPQLLAALRAAAQARDARGLLQLFAAETRADERERKATVAHFEEDMDGIQSMPLVKVSGPTTPPDGVLGGVA